MGLGDPFSTTYEGARQGLGSIGDAILGIAGLYAKQKQAEKLAQIEAQNKMALLERQAQLEGQITPKEEFSALEKGIYPAESVPREYEQLPPILSDYISAAQSKGKDLGLQEGLSPERQLEIAKMLTGVSGIPVEGKKVEKPRVEAEVGGKRYVKVPEELDRKRELEIQKLEKELAGGVSDKEELARATVLRKEFNSDQVYKNYQTVERSENQMKEAYKLATSPNIESRVAADQMLAVTFQKMLDPTSVVRESEYARTPEGVALMNRLGSIVEQAQRGGLRLKDEDRLSLIQAANKLLKSSKQQMNSHIRRYKDLSKEYSVDAKKILGNIDEFDITRTYMLNGNPYEIPDNEVEEFLKDNPTAQEI